MIHHISHIDLDGYACTYLVRYHTDVASDQLVQTNVDYDQLTQHLTDVLSAVDPDDPLGELLITDLNLKPKDVSVLLAYKDRYLHLMLLDHHQNTEEQVKRLTDTVSCWLMLNRDQSATKHVFDHLVRTTSTDVVKRLVDIVNAYDMFHVEDLTAFALGYTLNENFMELNMSLKGLATPKAIRVLATVYLKAARYRINNLYQEHLKLTILPDTLDEGLKMNVDIMLVGELEDLGIILPKESDRFLRVTDNLPYTQRVGVLQAAIMIGPEGSASNYLHEIGGVPVLLSPERLPRGMLHHLMYTMQTVDLHAIMTDATKGKVELRQHKLKPHVNLGRIAQLWGGGGHVGAAGFHTQQGWHSLEPKLVEILQQQLESKDDND
jgi:oligoribonuclease NrnB/cAMP/cGMP phosphodiesterase (DHH superfamily)